MGKFIDLSGVKQKTGRLTARKRVGTNKQGSAIWLCDCDCGNTVEINGDNFRRETAKSCGCLRDERIAEACKKYNTYDLSGEYGVGYFTNTNNKFLFSLQDYDLIKNYCWYEDGEGYARTNSRNEVSLLSMHELLVGQWCDHRNRNRADNRRENLFKCTRRENNINRSIPSNNTSSYIGVSLCSQSGKYQSYIGLEDGRKHLGTFKNKEDAVKARLKAEAEYWGEIAPQRHLFEQYGITTQHNELNINK